jgi:uncharacterized protein (TIGR02145 family)
MTLQYKTVNMGKLEVMSTNFHYSKLNIYKKSGECYFDFSSVLKIGEKLEKENLGFRIPTPEDFAYLIGLGNRWVDYNEIGNNIAGCILGKKAHEITTARATQLNLIDELALKKCVFLPAFGFYTKDGGYGRNFAAYYWSNYLHPNNDSAYILYSRKKNILNTIYFSREHGLPVRCVRDRLI